VAYGVPIEPMAIAHRGGAGLAPENTLRAFHTAMSLGFRYLETDVRLTRDGHLVCFHDATLDRVTDGRGRVDRYNLVELRSLRVFDAEPIPTLVEALDAVPTANFTIDLKDEGAIGPLAALLRGRRDATRVCIAGAWDGWLERLRVLVPDVRTALGWRSLARLVCRARAGLGTLRIAPARFAHVPLKIGALPVFFAGLVADAHRVGVRVVVWTVDDPRTMHWLLDIGVDGIITDRADVLREVLVERGSWTPMAGSPPLIDPTLA
jgi:glycerophosphoryl diester phosphodiesterase